MSVKVIRALLLGAEPVVAQIVRDSIVAGDVPPDAALPALSIKEVVQVADGAIDAHAEYSIVTSRVQVQVIAEAYQDVKTLRELARRACNFQRGQIAGVDVISIVRDTIGPDLQDPAGNHSQSIDFKVTYHEPN